MPKPPAKKKPAKRTEILHDWVKLRDEWEADPTLTFKEMSRRMGGRPTRQAIGQRAEREGWTRVDPNESAVQKAIRERADAKAVAKPVQGEVMPAEETPPPPGAPTPSAIDAAVEARAQVIDRHRRELNLPRNRIYQALQETDIAKATGKAKLAKLAAETLQIVQTNERRAWGFDADATLVLKVIPPSPRDQHD